MPCLKYIYIYIFKIIFYLKGNISKQTAGCQNFKQLVVNGTGILQRSIDSWDMVSHFFPYYSISSYSSGKIRKEIPNVNKMYGSVSSAPHRPKRGC